MGVVINELSVEITGLIVKNNNEAGNSVLRMSQDQAWEAYQTLGEFFSKNGKVDWDIQSPVLTKLTKENTEPTAKTG